MSSGSGGFAFLVNSLTSSLLPRPRPDRPLRNRLSEKEGMKKKELSANEALLCHKRGRQIYLASRLDLDLPVPSLNEACVDRMPWGGGD